MAKGSRGGKGKKGGGLNPKNIGNTTSLVSARESKPKEVDEVLGVSRDLYDKYGAEIGDFVLAELKGKDKNSTLAYFSRNADQIGFNTNFFDAKLANDVYDKDVAAGHHPSRGNKTGLEAIAAHEFGHSITVAVAKKAGLADPNCDNGASFILRRAVMSSKYGKIGNAKKISGYADYSNAETIAEAFADVYCNGKKANGYSRAIVDVIDTYLKK